MYNSIILAVKDLPYYNYKNIKIYIIPNQKNFTASRNIGPTVVKQNFPLTSVGCSA